jgi:opacity protein-like surface antigen
MKTIATALLTGLVLVTAAQAGTPITAAAPTPSAGLWQWFAGGSAGYLTDLEEPMYSLHAGAEYKDPGARGSHAIYLQVGFTQDYASYNYSPPPGTTGGITQKASIDLDIIPITLNYKYEAALTDRLNYFLGLGLGIAILDSSYDWSSTQALPPPYGQRGGSEDQTDVRFYGEVFAGLTYDVCAYFELYAGVRYIFMDDVDRNIDVFHASDYTAGINNDLLLEVGARFNF